MEERTVGPRLARRGMIGELKRLLKEEQGPTAVEYAIMLALVALAIVLGAPNFHAAVVNIFNSTSQVLSRV